MDAHTRAAALINSLLEAERIPAKRVFVGRTGSLLVTFYGRESAERATELFQPFVSGLRIGEGFDPGETTSIRNARRADVKVYRVAGHLAA